jgi:predicted transcriptional regulator
MRTSRDELKVLIDRLSDQEIVALWKVVAAMRQPEDLTAEEAAQVDAALKEIDAGQFTRLDELKRALHG